MVLSNKKLKQKLRSLLADSLTSTKSHQATGTSSAAGDVKQQLQTVRDLLTSKTQKPRTPKRPKKRKTPPPLPEEEDTQNDRKKRKMDDDGGQELTEEEEDEEEEDKRDRKKEKLEKFKMKRKKLQKRKQKLKEKKEKKERLVEKGDVETGEKPEAESIEVDESEVDPKKIYVGGIPYYSSEDDIRSFFEGCGTVTEVDCIMFPETGKFRGIAMLTFKTEAAAQRALALDGADMGGFYLKIQPYKASRSEKSDFAPEIVEGYNRIYIGNLSWDVTEDDVKKLFCECKVSSIRFGTDKETGEFKGYAHVDFSDSQSLEVALKLDQNEVCGRPVKIRCAVPTKAVVKKVKETVITGKSKKKKRLECFSCGIWGHVASACLRKPTALVGSVEASLSSKPTAKQAEDGTGTEDTKVKRRTCYECGVPGHLSSACPKKGAVKTDGTSLNSMPTTAKIEDGMTNGNTKKKRQTCYECGVPGHLSSACPEKGAVKTDGISLNLIPTTTKIEDGTTNGNTKKKRQTCYECGVPGHLSSACPEKGAVEASGVDTAESSLSLKPTAKKAEDETITVKAKKKRQTCYECGVPGHISSTCPKKSTVELGGSEAVETSLSLNHTAKKAEALSTGKTKKKRQTCYECGVPGHISSSCPKKGTVEVDGRNEYLIEC